ncbi:MAG: hypothetical protein RLZZ352_840 [Pseudomonadota bacterium]|jgi:lipid A ethanolaminephosphotransferase
MLRPISTFFSSARPWHPTHLLAVLALWLATVGNGPFWFSMADVLPSQGLRSGLILGAWALALTGFTLTFLALWVWPRWIKPAGIVLLFMAASANYFMHSYGVVIDPSMLANALHTDAREVRDLISPGMLLFLVGGVLLPGWWWWRQPLLPVSLGRLLGRQTLAAVLGLLVAVLMLWLSFQDLASTMRNHKSLRYMVNPFNTVYALVRNGVGQATLAQQTLQPVGEDAVLTAKPATEAEAPLIVLVVGETARAANFGLGGYARDTTPRLAALQQQGDLVYFNNVRSCGTNTQVSVPCMFSGLGREDFDGHRYRENLLDVLHRAGLAVLWLDNQAGCKGVCDRVPQFSTQALKLPGLCTDDECFDEVMLKVLPEQLALLAPQRRANGTVVVLHQMGSHGPAYFKRTPANFKPFQPECDKNNLQECSAESLVNTYDNTLRYTDHVLAETITWLQAQARPTALIYLSDHGESLGEKGLYLHGMLYSMAPDEQTHVPMLMWMNPAMQHHTGLDLACLKARAGAAASHDNLFHTMLGLTRVSTQVYQPALDLTAACR